MRRIKTLAAAALAAAALVVGGGAGIATADEDSGSDTGSVITSDSSQGSAEFSSSQTTVLQSGT